MLAALGIGTKKDALQLLCSRLSGLTKDPRGWQEVMLLVLRLVPEDTALAGLKDRRVLEMLLSLCEANLLPYPSLDDGTQHLLQATRRLLATRPLYAHLSRFPLAFFAAAATLLLRAATQDEDAWVAASRANTDDSDAIKPTTAWALLVELVGVLLAAVQLPVVDNAAASSEDARLEAAGRSHVEAAGLLATTFEVLAAGTAASKAANDAIRALADEAVGRALNVLHALLVARPEHTDYRVVVTVLGHAVDHHHTLFTLCRHHDDATRSMACAVLQAVLLEAVRLAPAPHQCN